MLTILVVILVAVAVNRIVMCLETVIYDYGDLEVYYSRSTSVWHASGSTLVTHDNVMVLVAPSCYGGLVVDSNSSSGAINLVQTWLQIVRDVRFNGYLWEYAIFGYT